MSTDRGGHAPRDSRRQGSARGADPHGPVQPSSHLTPQNLEAEEAVLGAMIMNTRAVETVDDVGLRTNDFYRPSHRILFDVIRELASRETVDELTVVNELRRNGQLEQVGGPVAVVSLAERVPSVANVRAYAEEVLAQSTLRGLVETGHEIARLGYEHPDDPSSLVDQAGVLISDLAQQRETADFVDAAELLGPLYDELTERAEKGGSTKGLPTGFTDFDRLVGGFQPGNLVIVAARPAMGKTSWVLNVAEHVALRENKAAAIFSLEMSADDLVTRMMCSVAKVDQKRIRQDVPHDSDWPLLVDAVGKLMQARGRLRIDQSSTLTPMELRTKVRRLHNQLKGEGGLGCVIIDYLQLMEAGKRLDSRQVEVSYISRQLKALALELQIPVIALSQLSRNSEMRNDKRPMLSDLRESGAIEQDADIVLFLHRPEYYDRDNPEVQGKAEVIVAKHRNGEVGSVWLGFLAKYTKFVNLDRHHIGPPPVAGASAASSMPPSGATVGVMPPAVGHAGFVPVGSDVSSAGPGFHGGEWDEPSGDFGAPVMPPIV